MVEDAEIERIRQQKLQERTERQQAEMQKQQQKENAKAQIAAQLRPLLTPDAWSQWNTALMSNEDNALGAGIALIQLSRSGRVQGRIGVEQVKNIIRMITGRTRTEWKISRR